MLENLHKTVHKNGLRNPNRIENQGKCALEGSSASAPFHFILCTISANVVKGVYMVSPIFDPIF